MDQRLGDNVVHPEVFDRLPGHRTLLERAYALWLQMVTLTELRTSGGRFRNLILRL